MSDLLFDLKMTLSDVRGDQLYHFYVEAQAYKEKRRWIKFLRFDSKDNTPKIRAEALSWAFKTFLEEYKKELSRS